MKRIINGIVFILTFMFLLGVKVHSKGNIYEEKIYRDYALNDNFASDSVLVVFKNNESKKLKDYDAECFKDIGVEKVYDLSSSTKEILRKIKANDFSFLRGENDIRMRLSVNNYHQILRLVLREKTKENVLSTIKKLMKYDDIIVAEPDYMMETYSTPSEWSNLTSDEKWGQNIIDLPSAWDYVTSSNNVLVGVIDTGIDGSHIDLNGNMYSSGNNDPYTYKNFCNGIIENSSASDYYNYHGTHVAGIIGAIGNNYIGVTGVCWNTKLISLKAFGTNENVSNSVMAIDYANGFGIDIINFSNGTPSYESSALRTQIGNYAGLFVCSAGNFNSNLDYNNHYPAKYRLSNMIVVGNSNSNDTKGTNSNYGQTTVDLFAPGTEIYSTIPGGYYSDSGTSMSAPFVTGVAALILGQNSSLSPQEVKSIIMDNVDVLDSLAGLCISNGRLNAYKAVRASVESRTFFGKVNNDNYNDMIIVKKYNSYYRFLVFKGKNDGSFDITPLDTITNIQYKYSDDMYSGDFNGDGKIDFLVHSRSSNSKRLLYVFIGTNTGIAMTPGSLLSTRYHDPVDWPCKCIVADKNGDHKDDFIVVYENEYYNKGIIFYTGTNSSPYLDDALSTVSSSSDYVESEQLFKGDFDNDGKEDLLVLSTYGSSTKKRRLLIYKATLSGYNEAVKLDSERTVDSKTYPSFYQVADVDGDGKDDFVVLFKQYGYFRYGLLYKGKNSSPYILEASDSPYALSSTNIFKINSPFLIGDINGDGYKDIVTVDIYSPNSRTVKAYFWQTGYSTFNDIPNYYNSMYTEYSNEDVIRHYVTDINGDGYDDLVIKKKNILSSHINLYTYLGSSSGFSSDAVTTALAYSYYD